MHYYSEYIWISPLIAMILAQILKPLLIMARLRHWDPKRMRQSGGMPSSHTALVVALVAELCFREGGNDRILALAGFVALVVMYDAAGVRWQTGRHAAVLNRLLRDLHASSVSQQDRSTDAAGQVGTGRTVPTVIRPIPVVKSPWWLVDWPVLDEHVGHKPTEVLGGMIVGLVVAWILH